MIQIERTVTRRSIASRARFVIANPGDQVANKVAALWAADPLVDYDEPEQEEAG